MKVRHPLLIKAIGFFGAIVLRLWVMSLRVRHHPLGRDRTPDGRDAEGHYIYAFWHEDILVPAHRYSRRDRWVLISSHADGRMIAEACRHLGIRVVDGSKMRGAKTRGGVKAVRQLLRLKHKAHLVITPDGPRGPRRSVQPGLVYLAAQTGQPIVPVGFGYRRAWRARSWDRFAVPLPGSAVVMVTAEEVLVPPGLGRAEMEDYRVRVERAMLGATAEAERRAARESW